MNASCLGSRRLARIVSALSKLAPLSIGLAPLSFGLALDLSAGAVHADPETASRPDDNTKFSFELYSQLRKGGGNIAFSPYSVEAAFAVALSGAKGDTAAEMAKVFHLPPGGENRFILQVEEQLSRLAKDGQIQISTANGLWVAKAFPILEDFIELAKAKFHAEVHSGDFLSAAEAVRKEINDWVSQKTNDKIRDLIAPGMLAPSTSLVIVNALYFKGLWEHEFEGSDTMRGEFFAGSGKTVDASMMHQTKHWDYSENADVQLLELPYRGGDVAMFVALPKARDGIGKLEEQLTPAMFAELINKKARKNVALTLPKFKMRSSMGLSEALGALGIRKAFVFKQADFSAIEVSKMIYISDVVHQAFIETDEKGTEAAAATAIMMRAGSARPREEETVVFKADHPFLFFLREKKTGAILLMGRVMEPS